MIIEKIVSGGQRGADEGALQAARLLSIITGGFAPPNFMTEDGPNPALGSVYGLIAVDKDPKIYPKRTRLNVEHSDGTLWMGHTDSPGGKLTFSALNLYRKPRVENPSIEEFKNWLISNQIKVLNVAGNRESKNEGIRLRTFSFLVEALREDYLN